MPEPTPQSNGVPRHPWIRFEPSDASFGWILTVLPVALLLGFIIHSAVLAFLRGQQMRQAKVKESAYPLAPGPSTSLPREPRLEQLDRLAEVQTPNIRERLARKEETLRRYGATEEKGFVHIPIDRALDLMQGKLKARPAPSAEDRRRSGGLVGAGESSSGRLFRRASR